MPHRSTPLVSKFHKILTLKHNYYSDLNYDLWLTICALPALCSLDAQIDINFDSWCFLCTKFIVFAILGIFGIFTPHS